ncbi:MAG: hypothetical protein V7739_19900 [Motiliproteus sp.]
MIEIRSALQLVRGPLVVMAVLLLTACTQVPHKEFGSYKESFAHAKEASKQIILDYSTLKQRIDVQNAAQDAASDPTPERNKPFDPEKIIASSDPVDHIAARFQAWEVVDRYNTALTALVEGKGAAQVTGATESLVKTMENFPAESFQKAAADITPALSVVTTLMTEIQANYDRERAVQALITISPKIREGLVNGMIEDTKNYFEVFRALNNQQISSSVLEIGNAAASFVTLAISGPLNQDVKDKVKRINDAVGNNIVSSASKAFENPYIDVTKLRFKTSGGNEGPLMNSQLDDNVKTIVETAKEIEAADNANNDYRKLLGNYVMMLHKLNRSLQNLAQAAKMGTNASPESLQLLYSAVRVQRAYAAYRKNAN